MALNSYALTTLARTKTALKISDGSSDSLLTTLINVATDLIEKYCDRRFKKTAYVNEVCDGNGTDSIVLDQYPVDETASFKLEVRASDLNSDSWSTIDSDLYHIKYAAGIVTLLAGNIFYKEPKKYRVSYTAGYDYDNAATFLETVGAGDLEFACWKLVGKAYNQESSSGNVQSESIGEYSVTFREALMVDKELRSILDYYKRPHVH